LVPTGVPGLENGIEIAAGGLHSLAITTKSPGDLDGGTVLAWGWNGYGQLADGSTATRLAPVAVPGLTGILKVAGGIHHSVAMGAGGAVLTWGWNAGGQLGDGTLTDRHSPTRVATVVDGTTVAAGAFHTLMG
jgi:alpha-tubulin suppressor-like RCC1 family protein